MTTGSLRLDGSLPIRIELVNVPRMLKDVRRRRLGPELHLVPYLVQMREEHLDRHPPSSGMNVGGRQLAHRIRFVGVAWSAKAPASLLAISASLRSLYRRP